MNSRFNFLCTPVAYAVLVLSLLTLVGSLGLIADILAFDSLLVSQGEIWRPFTAWFAQLNLKHWLLNQWGLVLMLLLLPGRMTIIPLLGFAWVWLICSFLLWHSEYDNYVGLSGLLYGWLCWAAYCSPFYHSAIKLLFTALLSAKVLSENGFLPLPLPQSGWVGEFIDGQVAHLSHLWGLAAGLSTVLLALTVQLFRSMRVRPG